MIHTSDSSPVLLDEYQNFTSKTDRNSRLGIAGIGFVLLGLFGEVGSLLSELKKKQRDKNGSLAYHDLVIEELGDTLWYFSNAALRAGFSLSILANLIPKEIDGWQYRGRENAVSFSDLQCNKSDFSGPSDSNDVEQRLLSLAGKVGLFIEDYNKTKGILEHANLTKVMVEIFHALVIAADIADVSLNEAARRNMAKAASRWPLESNLSKRDWGALYDENLDPDEQIPRRIEMIFREKEIQGKTYVTQQCNGIKIGDRLTDNRTESDDYRFHDVFHLAYAAILGWSPVVRSLFKVKRKSDPVIDENQDGARAIIIEEGVSTWIFNHGLRHNHFKNVSSIEYPLLKAVHELVKGYEVETRPLWQWEHAILEGFRIFREIRKPEYRGGIVVADLINRTIIFHSSK